MTCGPVSEYFGLLYLYQFLWVVGCPVYYKLLLGKWGCPVSAWLKDTLFISNSSNVTRAALHIKKYFYALRVLFFTTNFSGNSGV